MQQREDIKGGITAPEEVQKALVRFGGTNPYGEPMYRLVIAESVYSKEGGRWHDWDKNLSIAERGGLTCDLDARGDFSGIHTINRPIRVVDEIREVLKYPHLQGWVLERWVPAYMFGSQRAWYAAQATAEELAEDEQGRPYMKVIHLNLPLLGPYPERGDYMLVSSPRLDMIGIGELQEVIATVEGYRENYMATTQGQVDQRIYEKNLEQRQREQKERDETQYALRDAISGLASTSLQMGAYRTKLAERAGIFTHEGN